jgi:hypothetical protein
VTAVEGEQGGKCLGEPAGVEEGGSDLSHVRIRWEKRLM